ncbi:GDSL-like Lipase/Acylhydrolase superfamily protein [Artemisia annua]|uniref:GDSL-like Lipase/Acylhydrolase superfamily protein n=1 Tax=Artemisia annua TaxID=35608 RepID=A0A2U1PVC2_ARTAN|nr:GDSL-like Lipase/Acylhydrolase superfamily protein [Artemisia annua]
MLRRFWVLPVLVTLALLVALCHAGCGYEAIFNFGDSNSDTGGFWWAFPEAPPPNGMTYFKRPVGRASDGRLIIDFLAERIGIPFVSPYLKSIGSDFRHGANFATLASTVLLPQTSLFVSGLSPFALPIQLNQMKHFKIQVDKLYPNGSSNLPPPDVFGKSLYTFYIGQNDFTSDLAKSGVEVVKERLPQVISQITGTIKELHGLGGRTFFVQNLAPIGCYPAFLVELPHGDKDIDEFGCMIPYNNAVVEYNNMLHDALSQTRQELSDANIIYVDSHKALLELFQRPTSHGLKHGTVACCGNGGGKYNFNPKVFCGNTKFIDGQNLTASACDDPENYVSWDGIHITEAASNIVVDSILSSGFTDPPFEISCS